MYKESNNNYKYLPKDVNVPIELYQSANGKYFIGYGDNLQLWQRHKRMGKAL